MKNTTLVGFLAVPLMTFMLGLPALAADSGAPTTCKDGTTSTATGRGACSGHGGVQKAATTKAAPAAPAAAEPAAPAAPAASGAPSTCKDGTTSMATGRGACSGHGGVQKATKGKPASDAPAAAAAPAAATAPAAAPTAPAAAKSPASKSAPTAAASNTDPTGATAKCKDGTYSKSQHHSGTCSSHGGVAEWLTAQ
jgi:hypothetical protein